MAVTFGGKKTTTVTGEQLQATWDRALRQLEKVEQREELLRRQKAWIEANKDSDQYGEARRKHQAAIDEWYDEIIEEWHKRCDTFDRLLNKGGADMEAVALDIHEYARFGALGLYQLRADRANGVVSVFVPTSEPGF